MDPASRLLIILSCWPPIPPRYSIHETMNHPLEQQHPQPSTPFSIYGAEFVAHRDCSLSTADYTDVVHWGFGSLQDFSRPTAWPGFLPVWPSTPCPRPQRSSCDSECVTHSMSHIGFNPGGSGRFSAQHSTSAMLLGLNKHSERKRLGR